ncbi:hypothetical protein BaRGS_00010243 [Batillaria attramentaria]|uniref:poly(ADP-ribose) glycohydrolase n=1 Tax=Batillaria attramentaria TaxID=370345 RepID=A0ABD0LH77_9CAEN
MTVLKAAMSAIILQRGGGSGVDPAPSTSAAGDGAAPGTQPYSMSPELFPDSEPLNDSQDSPVEEDDADIPNKKPENWEPTKPWKGKPLDKLNKTPDCQPKDQVPKLEQNENHTVCVQTPFKWMPDALPVPFPSQYRDVWDNNHVRMPCSNQNEYPVEAAAGPTVERRWDMIQKALKADIRGPFELEEAILSYNQRYANKWNFSALHHFLTKFLTKEEREDFFSCTLPEMVRLALKLRLLCTKPIPLLRKDKAHKLTLSQQQIACLLANAFFCTFPRRNSRSRTAEYSSYPDINFNSLFQGQPNQRKIQKLKCIIHYFNRVLHEMPSGLVTFSRQVLNHKRHWETEMDLLKDLHVSSAGTIEDDGKGMLQVDFANKYLGGGVLGHGCVQEEIRFVICPELIVSRLFTEVLADNESLVMTGCEQYSEYTGYADSFEWARNHVDETPRDPWGRRCTEVVAIDALVFRNDYNRQFKRQSVVRELNKAYCGFMSNTKEANKPAVCTGNWGCGAFGGDKELKSMIQLMAASVAKRDVCYFTFDDTRLVEKLHGIHAYLQREEKTIGDIMGMIDRYNTQVVGHSHRRPSVGLFDYIHEQWEGEPLQTSGHSDFSYPQGFDDDSNEASGWGSNNQGSPDYRANTP